MNQRTKKSIAPQHITDEQSSDLMKRHLSLPDWIVRQDTRDYHIDYNIELGLEGNPDGQRFFVQLKGKKKLPNKSKFMSGPVKAEHLWYYANKCRLPVFLLLADIQNQKIYYTFLQKWIYESKENYEANDTKKIPVKIPRTQILDNTEDFRKSVKDALIYMNNRYPGSVRASIEAERRKWEVRDPNFDYDLSFSNNGTINNVTILPKEGKNPLINFTVKGNAGINAIRQNIDSGRPIKLTSEQVRLSGTKLFEGMGEFTFESKPAPTGYVDILITQNQPEVSTRPIRMTGELYRGNLGFTIRAKMNNLLELELVTKFDADGMLRMSVEKMNFVMSKWVGERMLTLSYFDQISQLAESLQKKRQINYEIDYNGLPLGKGHISLSDHDGSETTQSFTCRVLNSMRTVCTRINMNPVCPDIFDLSDDELEWWLEAASLIENDTIKRSGEGLKITGEPADPNLDLPSTGLFKIESNYAYSAFCGDVFLGRTEMILEGCHAETAICNQTGKHQFIVTGPPASTLTTRLI